MFVGIDWASTEHAVCVLDQTGKTVRELCLEKKVLPKEELDRLLDARRMTGS